MRKLETMFLKNLFDIQDRKKSARFALVKEDGMRFLLFDRAYAFRIFGAWFFNEDEVLEVLGQSGPYTKMLNILDDYDGQEIINDGTKIFAGHEVAHFRTIGDSAKGCVMNLEAWKLLQDYNSTFPFDGSLTYDFKKKIFRYEFGGETFAVILGIGGYQE